MSQDKTIKPIERQALNDTDLDCVSGGGFYYPVSDCPNGVAKLVSWFGVGVLYDGPCKTCPYKKETGGIESSYRCEKVTGDITWE